MSNINFIYCFFLSFLFLVLGERLQAQTSLIAPQSNWKYFDAGTAPAGAWTTIAYDDSSWASGNAELGYGDGDEATVVNNAAETVYFRQSFSVSSASDYSDLTLRLLRDDGAVVYLNGVEVWRSNMPGGAITYSTFASSTASEGVWYELDIANSLVTGTNVIAIEVHQRSATSSDISFDFELLGHTELINPNMEWKYFDAGTAPTGAWTTLAYDDSAWASGDAELGYGDGDEATVVNNAAETVYFRREFNVGDPTLFPDLTLNMLRDDGAVVYLNGVEVWRSNMPGGAITYNTFASSTATEGVWNTQVVANTLVVGTNIIAVEVHQRSATSSDISFNFELRGNDAISIVRGPYLQQGTANSIVVRWRTSSPTESILNYGSSTSSLPNTISDLTKKTDHSITISGLSPSTIYYYDIEDSYGNLKPAANDLYFKTAPTIGTITDTKIWVLGDCGTANTNQRNVRDAYYTYAGTDHTDMVLFLGDNAYNSGTDEEYQAAIFENMYEDILQKSVSWSTLGNHDGYTATSSSQSGPYYDIFTFPTAAEAGGVASGTEAYYSYDYANIHFIVLNSYDVDRSVGGTMYNWCLNDIQNTTANWIVAVWHHPAYTKGSHDSDVESALIQMRTNFLPILEDNGVDLVLCGHSHSYERSYFLKGHHGLSGTFNAGIHTVGATGSGDGRVDGDGIYSKTITGSAAGDGAVYITAGSSGKISGGTFNHAAMYISLQRLGSCIIETSGNEMNVQFLRETGAIDDYFTIYKDFVLPVELIYFDAMIEAGATKLVWETALEINNKGFEIERSQDGIFWDVITFQEGQGTSQEPHFYTYLDREPFVGDNYYRLKQIDEDGHFEYSEIKHLVFSEKKNFEIFPNPASEFLQIDYASEISQIQIFDALGNRVLNIEEEQKRIDISLLPEGIYFIELIDNGHKMRKTFIIN